MNYHSRSELKEKRIDELLDSCRDQVLRQAIGPFGLTPAMFQDKDGGNVTTTHNFEQGVVATEEDAQRYAGYKHNRESPIDRQDYDRELPGKRKEMFQGDEPIHSAWTGNELPRDGRTHLDHVTSVERIERDARSNLFMTKEERVAMANASDNLVPSESNINQSMGERDKEEWANKASRRDPSQTNAEHFGVDQERLVETKERSSDHIRSELLKAQIEKQGQELLATGLEEAGRNALRRAMGVVLYELVNGSFVEIKRVAKEPTLREQFVDHVIESLKNIAARIEAKLEKILHSIASGGVQGFISNLLTYMINNIVTTSAKVVTIIRESLKGLWEAIKLIVNPPAGMSGIEVARQATKIIAGVVTMGLGMAFEQSVKGFILSIPILAPLADALAPALSALLTGIMTALVIFGIDSLFDWLNASGTEKLEVQIGGMEASAGVYEKMVIMLDGQFRNSRHYQQCAEQYRQIEASLTRCATSLDRSILFLEEGIDARDETIRTCEEQFPRWKDMDDELDEMLNNYQLEQ